MESIYNLVYLLKYNSSKKIHLSEWYVGNVIVFHFVRSYLQSLALSNVEQGIERGTIRFNIDSSSSTNSSYCYWNNK